MLLDFKIRKTIANYEGRHLEKFKVKRQKLKIAAQKATFVYDKILNFQSY